jgi:pyrimidine deaminase RibD-like protein
MNRFLEEALELAARGMGRVSPNPAVGAVIVSDDTVAGRGFHTWAGVKHAEVLAIEEAGERARGATLYVTLEPCSHQGRTRPCAEAIAAAGIRKVVAPMHDPNPEVSGAGFHQLRAAGIDVEIDTAYAARATQINEAFIHFMRTGRPLVTVKAAVTLDGKIAPVSQLGDSGKGVTRTNWITGDKLFADGDVIERPDITIVTNTNTGPAVIYQAERYSMSKFTYAPVPNGDYTIKLHFCETFEGITEKGQRVFGYAVKGDGQSVKDFDVFATAGGALKPVVKTVPITVTNRMVQIEFTPQVENPQINAIEIYSGH